VERIPRLFNATTGARICTAVAAVGLYLISVSGRAYNLTSPVTMPHHELVRKILALLAFALLGFLLQRSNVGRVQGVLAGGIVIAVYSYGIELGQIVFKHSWETLAMHSFDVASGLAGGALGAFVALLMTAPAARSRRIEAAAIAFVFLVLAWGFTVTYGRLD
jgi:Kef-type K+ transport system membrane component KefB